MFASPFKKKETPVVVSPTTRFLSEAPREMIADFLYGIESDLKSQPLVKVDPCAVKTIWRRSSEAAAKIVKRKYPNPPRGGNIDRATAMTENARSRLRDGLMLRDKMAKKLLIKHGFLKRPIKLPWGGMEVTP